MPTRPDTQEVELAAPCPGCGNLTCPAFGDECWRANGCPATPPSPPLAVTLHAIKIGAARAHAAEAARTSTATRHSGGLIEHAVWVEQMWHGRLLQLAQQSSTTPERLLEELIKRRWVEQKMAPGPRV